VGGYWVTEFESSHVKQKNDDFWWISAPVILIGGNIVPGYQSGFCG
jgi:hypothetical protein